DWWTRCLRGVYGDACPKASDARSARQEIHRSAASGPMDHAASRAGGGYRRSATTTTRRPRDSVDARISDWRHVGGDAVEAEPAVADGARHDARVTIAVSHARRGG